MAKDLQLGITTPADTSGLDKTTRAVERTADAVDELGDQAAQSEDKLSALNREIAETERKVVALSAAIAATPTDRGLFKELRAERGALGNLQRVKRSLAEFADEAKDIGRVAGKETTKGLKDTLGALPSELKGTAIVAGIGLGVAMSPFLGAAISSAVLGVGGLGGIAGGIALAARDPSVKAAGSALASRMSEAFAPIGREFAGPTIQALDLLAAAGERFARNLDLGPLADEIPALAQGLSDFGTNITPALNEMFKAAEPILRTFAREMPDLANAFSDFFESLSSESDGAVLGLAALFDLLEGGLRITGDLLAALSRAWEESVRWMAAFSGGMEDVVGWLPLVGDRFRETNDKTEDWLKTLEQSKDPIDTSADSVEELNKANEQTTKTLEKQVKALENWAAVLEKSFDRARNTVQLNLDFEAAVDGLTESVQENGRTLDIRTEQGRKNTEALLAGLDVIEKQRQRNIEAGMTVDAVNKSFERQRKAFIDAAVAAGYARGEVEKLAAALFGLTKPHVVTVKFVSDTKNWSPPRVPGTSGNYIAMGSGGVVAAAAGTITNSPTVLFGERSAHGLEGFVPQRGISHQRAAGLLSTMAGWHGMDVVNRSGYGAGTMPSSGGGTSVIVRQPVQLVLDSRVVHEQMVEFAVNTGRTPKELWSENR